jgi:group II intron reverse transcriptase/maturase
MKHEPEKSDPGVVALKLTNKPDRLGAESVERRPGTAGNAGENHTYRTQCRGSVPQDLNRVRERARANKKERFTALMHHVTVELLRWAYFRLARDVAAGEDGQTWAQYGEQLDEKLIALHERVHRGSYRPQPSRRVYIAKESGGMRPLGVASVEDKIVQRAMVEILNAIYEVDFRSFSYGFRPGRSQHQALDALAAGIKWTKVGWILDLDVEKFFDRVSHSWLIRFLGHRIADPRVIRLIRKWLKAGVMEDNVWQATEVGTPQGAVISPLLANAYLHYTFDLWAERWRHCTARGNMIMVRYADDLVVGFQYERQARRFLSDLRKRFGQFALSLHPTKTRLIHFGRFAAEDRKRAGLGKPETFLFLGFRHICTRTQEGWFQLRRITRQDRMRTRLKALRAELKQRRHQPVAVQGEWLRRVVTGFFAYHAVPTNGHSLSSFRRQVILSWRSTLRRRSQKDRMTWARMTRLIDRWLPRSRILHPWPEARFLVRYPKWEPSARIAHARI